MSDNRIYGLISAAEGHLSAKDYKQFWDTIKEINDLLKSVVLLPDKRQEIWDWLDDRCKRAKSEMAAQDEERKNSSCGKRRLVETTIEQARGQTISATTGADLAQANETLKKASERMRDGYHHGFGASYMLTTHDGVLTKEDREHCDQLWQEAKDQIGYKRHEIFDANYSHFSSMASQAFNLASAGNGREAKDLIRQTQAEMSNTTMSRDQFSLVRNNLDKAWETACAAQRAKHDAWVQGTRDFIARMEALIRKNKGVITNLEYQIDHCEEMRDNARTNEFADEVQGWIDQKRAKIDDIDRTNDEVGEKIRDAEARLNS